MLKPTLKFGRRAKLSTLCTNNKPNGTERNWAGGGGGEGTHRSYWKNANLYLTGRMLISILLEEC